MPHLKVMFETGPPARMVCGKNKHAKTEPLFAMQAFHSFISAQMGAGLKTKTYWYRKKALFAAVIRLSFGHSS